MSKLDEVLARRDKLMQEGLGRREAIAQSIREFYGEQGEQKIMEFYDEEGEKDEQRIAREEFREFWVGLFFGFILAVFIWGLIAIIVYKG